MATSQNIPLWYTDAGKESGMFDYSSFPADNHGFPTPAGPAGGLATAQPKKPQAQKVNLPPPSEALKPQATSPTAPLGGEMPAPDMGSSMFQMPSMAMGQEQAAPAAAPQAQAMAGLEAAAPDQTPAAGFKGNAPGGINPNLGKRNLPNDISGLKALTY